MKLAKPGDWKTVPFGKGRPIPYSATFSAPEFAKVRQGLVPGEMEDKWFIYFEEPYLFFHRSWTGEPYYRVALEPDSDGARVREALLSDGRAGSDAGYSAALVDFLVSNLLLGQSKPFPVTWDPALKTTDQHVFAGTSYREERHAPRPPP